MALCVCVRGLSGVNTGAIDRSVQERGHGVVCVCLPPSKTSWAVWDWSQDPKPETHTCTQTQRLWPHRELLDTLNPSCVYVCVKYLHLVLSSAHSEGQSGYDRRRLGQREECQPKKTEIIWNIYINSSEVITELLSLEIGYVAKNITTIIFFI